jgi:predicted phage replisome organizer
MSDNKKYYWIKLKYDFFTSKEIKKLRKIAGGDTYTIIYLKMQLKSLKDDCKLFFEGVEDDFAEELALDIDEDVDNIRVTLAYLENRGLIELHTENGIDEYHLIEAQENTGVETASAIRTRRHRNKPKALQCNIDVTKSNTELETELKLDKDKKKDIKKKLKKPPKIKHLDFVLLTTAQYDSLIKRYGNSTTKDYIERVNNYVGSKGEKYVSHYHAILTWIKKDKVKELPKKKVCPDCKSELKGGGFCEQCDVYVIGV